MIHSLSHLRLVSPDPSSWRRHGEEVLGLTAADEDHDGRVRLRMDEHPARLIVERGDTAAVAAVGFEVAGPAELDEIARVLESNGHPVDPVSGGALPGIDVTEAITTIDPFGTRLEIAYGPARDHAPLLRRHVSGFVTGDLGLGHVVFAGEAFDETLRFYRDLLGFEGRNTMRLGTSRGTPGEERLWFLGCNARHHTVALMPRPGPTAMIHFMIEVATIDDVGRVHDRCLAAGLPQRLTLGRHTNDRMVSFYGETPDGFVLEVGCDGLLVAPNSPLYEITATSYWGHHRVEAPR